MFPRTSYLAVLLLAACPVFTIADDAPTTEPTTNPASASLAPTDTDAIKAKMGETVTIEGQIESASWSSSGKVMNIMFKDAGDDGVLVCAFQKNREKLDAAFDGDAAAKLAGAKVQITGKVETYGGKKDAWKGRPQIIVDAPEQVKVVEAAPAK